MLSLNAKNAKNSEFAQVRYAAGTSVLLAKINSIIVPFQDFAIGPQLGMQLNSCFMPYSKRGALL